MSIKTKEIGKYVVYSDGRVWSKCRERFLTPSLHKQTGYYRLNVNHRMFYVHRLVAECFLPRVEGKTHIRHIDRHKENNCVDNLAWITPKENIEQYWEERKNGLYDNYQPTPEMKAYHQKRRQVQNYKKYSKVYAQKRFQKLRNDPEKYAEFLKQQNVRSRKNYLLKRQNPEKYPDFIAREKERSKQHWLAVKSDPARHQAYLEKQKAYYWKQKNKNQEDKNQNVKKEN